MNTLSPPGHHPPLLRTQVPRAQWLSPGHRSAPGCAGNLETGMARHSPSLAGVGPHMDLGAPLREGGGVERGVPSSLTSGRALPGPHAASASACCTNNPPGPLMGCVEAKSL